MPPTHAKQWVVDGVTGLDSLKLQNDVPVPALGEKDVLVRCMPPNQPMDLLLLIADSLRCFTKLSRRHYSASKSMTLGKRLLVDSAPDRS